MRKSVKSSAGQPKKTQKSGRPPSASQQLQENNNNNNGKPSEAEMKTAVEKQTMPKSNEAKKQKQPTVLLPLEQTQNSSSVSAAESFLFPKTKVTAEPNEFELYAASEGLILDPRKSKKLGNIDDIAEERREEDGKAMEAAMKSKAPPSPKSKEEDKKKDEKERRVTIKDDKCVVFETKDLPTPDDEADQNVEDNII